MKAFSKLLLLIVSTMLFASCSYDDSGVLSRLDELESRVDYLEDFCKNTNTNIVALQTIVSALQNEDHIISVVKINNDGEEVGCVITFEKSGSITIYYSNSNVGSITSPVLGVAKDTDNVYYWTLNGEWLLTDGGEKIAADGTTPKLKVEGGYWWISYNNGATWSKLSEASTTSSTSMFQTVTYDENYAYFTLADGTILVIPISSIVSPPVKGTITQGCLFGAFSVSATKQVRFSQGNLQYQASTDKWRFSLQQYSYIGNAAGNTTTSDRDAQDDWIDLFGFGTSGWTGGVSAYQPWSISTLSSDYYVGGASTVGLTGNSYHADWGSNAISNGGNATDIWRTLTFAEWTYLFSSRADKYALATIGSVAGMLLLPDAFTLPSGCNYTAGSDNAYLTNAYSLEQWGLMQDAGAVFLPAAGYRNGTTMKSVDEQGRYWSVDTYDANNCKCIYILSSGKNLTYCSRAYGMSVRLVQDVK